MTETNNQTEAAQKKAERDAKQKESEQLLHRLIQEIDDDPDNYHTYYDLGALLVNLKSYAQADESVGIIRW